MVSKADRKQPNPDDPDEAVKKLYHIPPERKRDPSAYGEACDQINEAVEKGLIKPVDMDRYLTWLNSLCEQRTGVTLADAERLQQDPLVNVRHFADMAAADLGKLKIAIGHVDCLRMADDEKKKLCDLIDQYIAIQARACEDSVVFQLYVMRDSEGDVPDDLKDSGGEGFFKMDWHHIRFHRTWNDPDKKNSVIVAPPGSSKTTCLRAHRAWRIGKFPHRRRLILNDTDDKAQSEVLVLQRIISSPRYRAVFPEIRILGKADMERCNSSGFTVTRVNRMSRERTVEAAAIMSKVNGKGFDEIDGDDFSPPEVRHQESVRRDIRMRWNAVIRERLRSPASASIRIICTLWHEDDVPSQIIRDSERGIEADWLIAAGDVFGIKDDANGKAIPLWPEKFDSQYYEAKKRRLGDLYDLVYRGRARSEASRCVRQVQWYDSTARTNKQASPSDRALLDMLDKSERYLSIDPSGSSGSQSSDHGVIDAVITPRGYAFVTGVWFHHMGPVAMRDWVIRQIYYAAEPGYAYVHFEGQGGIKGMTDTWLFDIERALRLGEIPEQTGDAREILHLPPLKNIPVFQSTGTRMGNMGKNIGKVARLREVAALIENGFVRLPGTSVWIERDKKRIYKPIMDTPACRLAEILTSFDGSNTGDAVDALTQWVINNRNRINDPKRPAARQEAVQRGDSLTEAFCKRLDSPSRFESENEPYGDELAFYAGKVA